jgi:hypothetical protein
VSGTCEAVHVNSYDVHTRSPKTPLQGCVRLASIAVGVHWSFSFRFKNLNNSPVFRFLQSMSLQNIAHKFSYDLCTHLHTCHCLAQYFPYNYFCKRAHEVRCKQLATLYWQVKRNKNGRALHRLETNEKKKMG